MTVWVQNGGDYGWEEKKKKNFSKTREAEEQQFGLLSPAFW